MDILISDLINRIKEVFDSTKVNSVETLYEKVENSDELKLIISMDKILYDDINIIYTKLIFRTDNQKTKLVKNHFTYLYDINCQYVRLDFNNISDIGDKIKNIFNNNKFGDNIKILSEFIKSPSTLINKWFEKNDITNISIVNIETKKISIVPCKMLIFEFDILLNNNLNIKLKISKEDGNFVYSFNIYDKIFKDVESSLNNKVETIGTNLQKNIKI